MQAGYINFGTYVIPGVPSTFKNVQVIIESAILKVGILDLDIVLYEIGKGPCM
ncbi:hypothetical protein [Solibacillus sp. R5-41]|uniref:hypothetical protein n=1 Tax=Solibacillus sp. R5-41 TaxID=2048654 RepID=UPI0012FDF2C9|nr:hypothetical protein [Solibacillus sp. R5-41]